MSQQRTRVAEQILTSSAADPLALMSEEAEEAVIGAVIISPDQFPNVSKFLTADDFFLLRTRYVWQAVETLHDRDEAIDYLTLMNELQSQKHLEEIGGVPYLTNLMYKTPQSIHAEVYGQIVKKLATRRKLASIGLQIQALSHDTSVDVDVQMRRADALLGSLIETGQKQEMRDALDLASEVFDRVEAAAEGRVEKPISTGLADLDEIIGGWYKTRLTYTVAATGMGKSISMYNFIREACKQGKRVALWTMEIAAVDVVMQLIGIEMGVKWENIRDGKLTPLEQSKFTECAGRVAKWKLDINDASMMTPRGIFREAQQMQKTKGLDIIFIDYFQKLRGDSQEHERNATERYMYVSNALKAIAVRLELPVVVAAQAIKDVARKQEKPAEYNIQWSSTPDQDADVLIGLYRDSHYNEASEFPNQMDMIVLKNRQKTGSNNLGTASVFFDRETGLIANGKVRRVTIEDDPYLK